MCRWYCVFEDVYGVGDVFPSVGVWDVLESLMNGQNVCSPTRPKGSNPAQVFCENPQS